METETRTVYARGMLTPTPETELQAYRATRRVFWLILLCVGCGMIIASQLFKIGFSLVRILIFEQPVYSAFSLWLGAAGVVLAVLLLIFGLFTPRRSARRRIRRLKETYGEIPTLICEFEEDGVALRSDRADAGVRFAYPAIRRCAETKDLFVLLTKEKQFFSVEKQRLEYVDEAGFRALIRAKCPKAKVNWRETK